MVLNIFLNLDKLREISKLTTVKEEAEFTDANNAKVESIKHLLQRHPDVFANLIQTLQAEADSVVQDEEVEDNEQEAEVEVVIEVGRA